ncbi:hypothetical protein ACQ4PT_011926 [Festuca glaucescens]
MGTTPLTRTRVAPTSRQPHADTTHDTASAKPRGPTLPDALSLPEQATTTNKASRQFALLLAPLQQRKETQRGRRTDAPPPPSPSPLAAAAALRVPHAAPPMAKDKGNTPDLLDWVGPDISAAIFRLLHHPAHLLRASAAQRSWRRFVVENDFCRKLCERLCPEAATLAAAVEDDGAVPETLTYRLCSDICVVHEIKLQPFKAYFQIGQPIYSSRMVRFRMGHCKLPRGSESFVTEEDENQAVIADENYLWTYTSPEFPMLQENSLQSFKLPRPVLCIGGVVKIELLGGVQKQASDDRYYICVCHAQVVGRSLSPVLMVDISDDGGRSILKYLPAARGLCAEEVMQNKSMDSLEWHTLLDRYRHIRHLAIMQVLTGHARLNEQDGAVGLMEQDELGGGDVSDDDNFA